MYRCCRVAAREGAPEGSTDRWVAAEGASAASPEGATAVAEGASALSAGRSVGDGGACSCESRRVEGTVSD